MNKGILITGYKRTTEKQYSLLTHEMARFSAENYQGKGKQALRFWHILTEKLNAMGPPYRTVSQWKKVWTDYRRFHSRKGFKSNPTVTKTIKEESEGHHREDTYRADDEGDDITQTGYKTTANSRSSKVADFLRSETEEYEQNYESMNSILSNDFADEYSYPDRHSQQHHTTQHETLIPDETPYNTLNYSQDDDAEEEMHEMPLTSTTHKRNITAHQSLPPLQPANTHLIDQTLYTLQNQIEQQTKLLEHLSQISSTMATLMERQVNAIEKQTEAVRRQASATEHHTLVMNNFVDMIREKMPKGNSKTNLSNVTKEMHANTTDINLQRSKEKRFNKRWTDDEIKQLLEYMQEHQEFEKPTAQIYYRKFLASTSVDASWDLIRWKVKHLRVNYNKAETWRKSTEANLLETDEGVLSVQEKLKKICRFYDEMHSIFGPKTKETPFENFDNAITNNSISTTDSTLDDQAECSDFGGIEDLCLTPDLPVCFEDKATSPTTSSVPSELHIESQQKSKVVQKCAGKLKRSTPTSSPDQLPSLECERNTFLKMKLEFEKDKFKKEFELEERKFADEIKEKKQQLKAKELKIFEEERLRKLELEKQEKLEKYEIEKRYKYGTNNNE